MLKRTNTLAVETPEGISFSFDLAGPLVRSLALAVDLGVISAASGLVGGAVGVIEMVSSDLARAVYILAYFAISIGYGIAAEYLWRGQTLGKRLLRLRVMDVQGLRIRLGQVVVRNLLRFVDMLPALYLVGGLTCLLNRRFQRLGDIAANTIVIRTPAAGSPDLDQIMAGKFNSFRDYPHLGGRLRQLVGPQEAAAALRALLRRDSLDPEARVSLFREIAEGFRARVAFPDEAAVGLSDEQYVRNVVDILFRPRRLSENRESAAKAV
jgi:uncharacterized RDD family membrane protein YckC